MFALISIWKDLLRFQPSSIKLRRRVKRRPGIDMSDVVWGRSCKRTEEITFIFGRIWRMFVLISGMGKIFLDFSVFNHSGRAKRKLARFRHSRSSRDALWYSFRKQFSKFGPGFRRGFHSSQCSSPWWRGWTLFIEYDNLLMAPGSNLAAFSSRYCDFRDTS